MNTSLVRGKAPLFLFLAYGLLLVLMLVILFPFLYVVFTSFATREEILTRGFFLIPHQWTLDAYGYLMNSEQFVRSFRNAVTITVFGTAINMIFTTLMAYGLAKRWLKGRRTLNFMILFTMLFNGGIIPTYIVVQQLHLLDSYWALYLTAAIAPFHLIVMRSFFQNIPLEIEESARIDGCGELRLLLRIVLPLSMPAIATFTLFYTVQNWNSYFNAILYLTDSNKLPLQVYIKQMQAAAEGTMNTVVAGYDYSPSVKMAAVVLTAAPLMIIYPFLQKYFNQGMLLGSVKG
ncbi:carbohydrate ABC transporter permease [Paenibacillus sp. HB172176]|uniref:carbohydrate ABC transporter permease n=1 Tax=Paenibacillus sp. HB172176 TaxID=2493690 RepID=UPI00143AE029|nr:carbohydrate ABC transporter permease [Paenibacillus sp. HB172176]